MTGKRRATEQAGQFEGVSAAAHSAAEPNRSGETLGITRSTQDAAGQSTPTDTSGSRITLPLLLTVPTLYLVCLIALQPCGVAL